MGGIRLAIPWSFEWVAHATLLKSSTFDQNLPIQIQIIFLYQI